MGRVIYVDSGFLVALFDPDDPSFEIAHELHVQYLNDQRVTLAMTWDVINEFLAHYSRQGPTVRALVARYVWMILRNPKYRIEAVAHELYLQSLTLYESRLDKRYSMVDCIGMTIMRRDGINEVVTADRDFVQEGFVNLMR